jgi:hypothetical protein
VAAISTPVGKRINTQIDRRSNMKRSLIVFMVVGLVAGSVMTAEAKGNKRPTRVERTVEGSYGPYPSPVTGCNEPLGTFSCMVVATRWTESFYTAKVTDTHGQPVLFSVWSDYGDGEGVFCGETPEPIAFSPHAQLHFHVAEPTWITSGHALECPANRIKTTGTISVTLSNRP